MAKQKSENGIKIVRATTAFDCGGRCPLRLHVRDNVIIRVEGDDAPEPEQLRACLRCRAYRKYVHHPDRLMHPMKRSGARGEGRFERISWDEALETIATQLRWVRDTYGHESIFLMTGSGCSAALHGPSVGGAGVLFRLLAMFGGFTTQYGNISSEGSVWATVATYGDVMVGHSREDFMNSCLIIMWGWDPARMISGTNTMYYLIRAKEAGVRIISIGPRYDDSTAVLADQWIPIYPGTDTAMMVAMAHVIIRENLLDRAFLDKYTIGFDKFEDYVLGREDGTEKTPEWAEPITGVKAAVIRDLAREYATTKPAALVDCQGPARSAMGEQYNRCAIILTAMTGNIGRPGGSAAGGLMALPIGHAYRSPGIPGAKNPVEMRGKRIAGTIDIRERTILRVHLNKIWDAMLKGKAGGYPADIKFVWSAGNNFLTQLANSNKGVQALRCPEFIVVSELFITPTAKFADILLPVTSMAERADLTRPWPSGPYFAYVNRALQPLGECKSDLEIATMLAPVLGIKDFNAHSEEEWLKMFVTEFPENARYIKDYEKFKREGVQRIKLEDPIVAFKKQIEDPAHNPFPTPSGKIEIYSQRIADLNNPLCPPIPKHMGTWEDRNDPLIKKYPLQLLSPHARVRAHSDFTQVEWLMEVEPDRVWINTEDAVARGIKDGDEVYVFNDRGKLAIKVRVTERIMPGVVSIFEGAWYNPDSQGIDRGGCANTLTRDEYSGGGACAFNTCLVQISRA